MIALLVRRDPHHERCHDALRRKIRSPMVTLWPAVTEAMYVLGDRHGWSAQDRLWELLRRRMEILAITAADLDRMRALMKTYRTHGMDLADAALVAVAEREAIRTVFTVDRRDFLTYRPARLGHFTLLP
jgi:predicted nucleic acid-binding protein